MHPGFIHLSDAAEGNHHLAHPLRDASKPSAQAHQGAVSIENIYDAETATQLPDYVIAITGHFEKSY